MAKTQKIIVIISVVVSIFLAFLLGRFSVLQNNNQETSGINIITSQDLKNNSVKNTANINSSIEIRGSSQGSKYYFPWCKSTFNEENTIYFKSIEDAKTQGYEQATGCFLEPDN